MSKQASPTVIGAFVVGAVALIAIAVAIFGGGEYFATKNRFVTYFDGSVKGLRVGSNVLFRGVRIGYVADIDLVGDVDTLETFVPVIIEVVPDTFRLSRGGKLLTDEEAVAAVDYEDMLDAGLKAQLGVESFITGQLLIQLDFHPDRPTVLRGQYPEYPEIPSIPSATQEVLEQVQSLFAEFQAELDVGELLRDIQASADGLNRLINSEELYGAVDGASTLLQSDDVQSIPADLRSAIKNVDLALSDIRALVLNADGQIETILSDIQPAAQRLDATLASLQKVLDTVEDQIQSDSETAYQFNRTLREVEDAARSFRIFMDYIERDPSALIRGKSKE